MTPMVSANSHGTPSYLRAALVRARARPAMSTELVDMEGPHKAAGNLHLLGGDSPTVKGTWS